MPEKSANSSNNPWPPAPEGVSISAGEVHVWRAELDTESAARRTFRETLSDDERERAERFRFDKDRHRFITARVALRSILGRYLNITPREVRFSYNTRGKPALTPGHRSRLRFNLSHSRGLALCAVTAGREVGVDLEKIRGRPAGEKIAERFFSREETDAIRALPVGERAAAFFACWTRKEACLKARGGGLTLKLDTFTVPVLPVNHGQRVDVIADTETGSRWTLWNLLPDPGYVAALAVEGADCELRCWNYEFE